MTKKRYTYKYTLVEIIVSMAIFSILVMIILQLFGGVQNLWKNSVSKNNTYSDARVAMSLMANSLAATVYESNITTFKIMSGSSTDATTEGDSIEFYTRYPFEIDSGENDVSNLYKTTYSFDKDKHEINIKTYNFRNSAGEIEESIINCVTDLTFKGIDPENSSWSLPDTSGKTYPPMIEISLSLLPPDVYERWKALEDSSSDAGDELKEQYGHTFNRVIYLGK